MMKSILIILISFALVVSGASQTRNVVVGTNGAVVQPTNFWSADASNARTGLGIGSSATNPASAFQSSSSVLSNLASSNAVNLTNVRASNIVGSIALASNVSGIVSIANGGTGGSTAGEARSNLAVQPASVVLSNLSSGNGSDLTNISISNLATISISGGGTGATNAATARTNLGIGATWLTNTNIANFRIDIGLGWPALTNTNSGAGLVSVNTNGEVVSPTNFWQVAPIQTLVQTIVPVTNSTNAATNARNLYVYSLATNIINVTNTITFPTNTSAFDGDEVTVIHRGGSNSVTTVRQLGSTNNLISLNSYDEAVKFIKDGSWDFYHNISYTEDIRFSGTNTAANAAASRTNLGLGWSALTNTNSSFGLIGFTTNGNIVIENTNTNSITITNPIVLSGIADITTVNGRGATLGYFTVSGNTNTNTWAVSYDGNNYFSAFSHNGSQLIRLTSTNINYSVPIIFSTNTASAQTRTNLGIPLAALTNTNNATFQEAIFTTNTAPTNAGNFGNSVAWMGVSIVTNGVTNTFLIPLYK